MEPDILIQIATWASTLPRLQLLPTLLAPAPLLSHLWPALPPRKASDWSDRVEATLKAGGEDEMGERGKSGQYAYAC
jgi:hypothetical protein